MARLHGDGFDHYGDDESNMLDGEYAEVAGTLSTSIVATGTHSLYCGGLSTIGSFSGTRKVLPSSKDKMGAMGRFYFPQLPANLYSSAIFCFHPSSPNFSQVVVFCDANGALRFVRGETTHTNAEGSLNGGVLIAQSDPIINAASWNHIEVQVYIHDTDGWVRVAVNGVHEFEATGLDTKHNSDNIVSVSQYRPASSPGNGDFYLDDYALYDFNGSSATDTDWCPTTDGTGKATGYIGDLQAALIIPNADTSEADWAKSTGVSGYPLVGKATPNDATYIYSTAAGDLSEFALSDLPAEITYIRGLDIIGRLSKADGGAAMTKFGMKSVASRIDAAERPVTVEATYWRDQSNVDPNTGAATGTLTFTNQPANGETVTIGAKVYTYQTVLTNVDGNVLIGANLTASISNLAAAINGGAGSGTAYAAATVVNTQVTAVANATTLVITAIEAGTGGNAIATTETVANASWGAATMAGGSAGSRWTRASLNAAWMRLTRSV